MEVDNWPTLDDEDIRMPFQVGFLSNCNSPMGIVPGTWWEPELCRSMLQIQGPRVMRVVKDWENRQAPASTIPSIHSTPPGLQFRQ